MVEYSKVSAEESEYAEQESCLSDVFWLDVSGCAAMSPLQAGLRSDSGTPRGDEPSAEGSAASMAEWSETSRAFPRDEGVVDARAQGREAPSDAPSESECTVSRSVVPRRASPSGCPRALRPVRGGWNEEPAGCPSSQWEQARSDPGESGRSLPSVPHQAACGAGGSPAQLDTRPVRRAPSLSADFEMPGFA